MGDMADDRLPALVHCDISTLLFSLLKLDHFAKLVGFGRWSCKMAKAPLDQLF
jgi:hypothetical protein